MGDLRELAMEVCCPCCSGVGAISVSYTKEPQRCPKCGGKKLVPNWAMEQLAEMNSPKGGYVE